MRVKLIFFAYSRIYVVVTLLHLRFERTIRIQRSFTHLNLLLNLLNRNRGACACETALLHHFFQFSSNFKARIGEKKTSALLIHAHVPRRRLMLY